MPNKKTGAFSLIVIFMILIVLISFAKGDPIDITADIGCIGGNYCLVGEILKLNVKINNYDNSLINQSKPINIISDAILGEEIANTAIIGVNNELSIPLKLSMKEGTYKIKVTSDLINVGNSFDKLRLGIKYLIYDLIGKKYTFKDEIEIKYPFVEPEDVGFKCNGNGFYLEEVKLKLEDTDFKEFECKIRIYTNKLVSTNHRLLIRSPLDEYYHYYENNFTTINKADLTGSIQKITFTADPAVEQTDAKIVPVCLIDNNEVEIEKYKKKLLRCKVNKKSPWDFVFN